MSREIDSIIAYLKSANVQFVVTSTTGGLHAPESNHYKAGTPSASGPKGLAVDVAVRFRAGKDPGLRVLFDAFKPVEAELAELICSWSPYSIKYGKKAAPIDVDHHWDHVHIAVRKGPPWLQWPESQPVHHLPEDYDMPARIFATCPTGGFFLSDRDGWVGSYNGAPALKLSLPGENVRAIAPISSFVAWPAKGATRGFIFQTVEGHLYAIGEAPYIKGIQEPENRHHLVPGTFSFLELDDDSAGLVQIQLEPSLKPNAYHWRLR